MNPGHRAPINQAWIILDQLLRQSKFGPGHKDMQLAREGLGHLTPEELEALSRIIDQRITDFLDVGIQR